MPWILKGKIKEKNRICHIKEFTYYVSVPFKLSELYSSDLLVYAFIKAGFWGSVVWLSLGRIARKKTEFCGHEILLFLSRDS